MEIAENCGVSLSIQPENGSFDKIIRNSPSIIYQIPTKSFVPDGNQIIKSDSSIFLQEEDCYGMVQFQ